MHCDDEWITGKRFLQHLHVSHGVIPLTGSKTIDYLDPVQYSSHRKMCEFIDVDFWSEPWSQNHTRGLLLVCFLAE